MGWLWAFVAAGWAQPPDGIRPVVVRDDAPARYRTWRAREGLPPADLSCLPAGPPGLLLCFRVWEHGERRWVHRADLVIWGTSPETMREQLEQRSRRVLAKARWVDITGMSQRYLQVADGDGWAAAGVVAPEVLAERLGGGPVRFAMPSQSVMVAYRGAGVDLDRVMAVGVRELYAEQPQSVSPAVYEWTAEGWRAFGEAVPRAPNERSPPR